MIFSKDHLLMEAENQLRNLCMKVQLNDLKAIKVSLIDHSNTVMIVS